jgi:hypothetical protein
MGLGSSSDSLMGSAVGDGAVSRGYAVYFNRPGVAVVTWDPTLKAVYVDVQGWADSTELASLLDAGLQALTEHHASRWLADARNMKAITQSDEDWIVQTFFPRALTAGLKHIALVIPNECAMKTVDQLMVRRPAATFEAAYFATVDGARSWLTESPTRPE